MYEWEEAVEARLFKKNWWHVLTRAWSSWFIIAATLLTGAEMFAMIAWEHGLLDLPAWGYPILMLFLTMSAMFARLMVQHGNF